MDFDRPLVLDKWLRKKFDHPWTSQERANSSLERSPCEMGGKYPIRMNSLEDIFIKLSLDKMRDLPCSVVENGDIGSLFEVLAKTSNHI